VATKAESKAIQKQQVDERIARSGVRPKDFHAPGRLSEEQIRDIPHQKIYEWVREGSITGKHFSKWVNAVWEME